MTLLHVTGKDRGAKQIAAETAIWRVPSPLKELFQIPAEAHVRNDGKYVVLQDQYPRRGYGDVLTLLDARGQKVRAYTLDDLFSKSEIYNEMTISVSSIWWSANGLFRFSDKNDRFGFLTQDGTTALFDLATGDRLPVSAPDYETFRENALRIERHDLSGANGAAVDRGIV